MFSNAGARPGDVLLLTKPLGTGIVGTAIKFDRVPPALAEEAIASMRTLNRAAAEALAALPAGTVHACTDVTGFGLVGHATEMAAASRVTISLDAERVPLFKGVLELVAQNRSGGLISNEEHFGRGVRIDGAFSPDLLSLLNDPQTSGGLLVSVAATAAAATAEALQAGGVGAVRIGDVRTPIAGVPIVICG